MTPLPRLVTVAVLLGALATGTSCSAPRDSDPAFPLNPRNPEAALKSMRDQLPIRRTFTPNENGYVSEPAMERVHLSIVALESDGERFYAIVRLRPDETMLKAFSMGGEDWDEDTPLKAALKAAADTKACKEYRVKINWKEEEDALFSGFNFNLGGENLDAFLNAKDCSP